MPTKVSWGEKLTAQELQERNDRWHQACYLLLEKVIERLKELGANAEYEFIHPCCQGCFSYPSECPFCKVDAAMSSHFEKPGISLKIIPES